MKEIKNKWDFARLSLAEFATDVVPEGLTKAAKGRVRRFLFNYLAPNFRNFCAVSNPYPLEDLREFHMAQLLAIPQRELFIPRKAVGEYTVANVRECFEKHELAGGEFQGYGQQLGLIYAMGTNPNFSVIGKKIPFDQIDRIVQAAQSTEELFDGNSPTLTGDFEIVAPAGYHDAFQLSDLTAALQSEPVQGALRIALLAQLNEQHAKPKNLPTIEQG